MYAVQEFYRRLVSWA